MISKFLDKDGTYKQDKGDVYGSVVALPYQIEGMWRAGKNLRVPASFGSVSNVVVMGMGGSALGARVILGMYQKELDIPLIIVNDYHLPGFVNEDTLVVLSSYSGNTEEVIAAAKEAKKVGAKVFVITTGGKLGEMSKANKWNSLVFVARQNPSNQPRMAIGYSVMAILVLFDRVGLLKVDEEQVKETVGRLKQQQKGLVKEVKSEENMAKKLAEKIKGKGVVMVGSRHLLGAVHVFKNQVNENAKTFAARFDLPELNHHLLEGLGFPKTLKNSLHFLLFDSELYEAEIRRRLSLTEEVIVKQEYSVTKIQPESESTFGQVWETIQFGAFVGFYLSMLNKIDPAPIPWVDWFKEKLEE